MELLTVSNALIGPGKGSRRRTAIRPLSQDSLRRDCVIQKDLPPDRTNHRAFQRASPWAKRAPRYHFPKPVSTATDEWQKYLLRNDESLGGVHAFLKDL